MVKCGKNNENKNPRRTDWRKFKSLTPKLKQDPRGLKSTNNVERAVIVVLRVVKSVLRSSYENSCATTYPGRKSKPVWRTLSFFGKLHCRLITWPAKLNLALIGTPMRQTLISTKVS